jgi:hypothetical protein
VANRQAKGAGDGKDDPAFGGAVELGEDDAGDADGLGELPGLGEAVLAGGGVEDKKNFLWGALDQLAGGALHFFELGHQVALGVEAAGGVDQDGVGAA